MSVFDATNPATWPLGFGAVPPPVSPPPDPFMGPMPPQGMIDPQQIAAISQALMASQQQYRPGWRDALAAGLSSIDPSQIGGRQQPWAYLLRGLGQGLQMGVTRQQTEAAKRNAANLEATRMYLSKTMGKPTAKEEQQSAYNKTLGSRQATLETPYPGKAVATGTAASRALTKDEAKAFGVAEGTVMSLAEIANRLGALRTLRPKDYGSNIGGSLAAVGADPAAIADAIIRGDQPPVTTGLYRAGAAVRTELAKRKYDLTKAQADWNGLTRYYSGLNTGIQLRLRQAIENGYSTAEQASQLNDQLSQLIPRSNLTVLNKASLTLAREGLQGGPEATAAAQQLVSFVNALQFELANVYMGGGVPTDQASEKAREIINPNMSPVRLRAAIDAAKRELGIRRAAIYSAGTVSPSNPPTGEPQTSVSVGARSLQTGAAGDSVLMRRGNQTKLVPRDQVEQMRKLGATEVR